MLDGLIEIDIAAGTEKPMPGRRWRTASDFTWLPDGSGVLIAAQDRSAAPEQVWVVSYPGGAVRRISNDLSDYLSLAVSGDGNTIASVQTNIASNLWVAASNAPDTAKQVTLGRLEGMGGLTFTPDHRIVYTGSPSGNWDVFMVDADGGNIRQLTFDSRFHRAPTVCDNGHSVVYDTNFDGASHLWKLDLQGGASTKLTNGAAELIAQCGGTGDWVFYWGQVVGGSSYIFKMPMSGGASVRLSDRIALSNPFVSLDGHHVVFATPRKDRSVGATIVSAETGSVESELNIPPTFAQNDQIGGACWMPDNRSVAIADIRTGTPNLWSIPVLGGGLQKQLTHFTSGVIWDCHYSPDGKLIVMARGSNQSDVVLFTGSK